MSCRGRGARDSGLRRRRMTLSRFFPQSLHKLFIRVSGDKSIELGAIIVDDADVIHDGIVDFPLPVVAPQFIDDRDLVAFGLDDRGFHLRKAAVYRLAAKAHLLTAVEIDLVRVHALEKFLE